MTARKRFEKIYVEISDVCNLRCDFCPEVGDETGVMGPELFRRVIADAAPLAEQVCFHLLGEPLTHPRFAEYVSVCAAHRLPVNVTTNGTLLDEARVEALLHPIVRQVNFSVQSFAANFPGRDVGPYLEKIFAFTLLAFRRRPDLYVNYRLWNLEAEVEKDNTVVVARVESAFGVRLDQRVDVRRQKGRHVLNRLYLHFDTRFEWPSLTAPRRSDIGTCRALASHLGILSDGTVVPCCLDKDGATPLGDAGRETLGEILAGERAARMAQGFKEGRLVEELCRRCTFISRFDRQASRLADGAATSSLIS